MRSMKMTGGTAAASVLCPQPGCCQCYLAMTQSYPSHCAAEEKVYDGRDGSPSEMDCMQQDLILIMLTWEEMGCLYHDCGLDCFPAKCHLVVFLTHPFLFT